MAIEAGQEDSSFCLKRKHYDVHRKELMYGGFLGSTSMEYRRGDGSVVATTCSSRTKSKDHLKADEDINSQGNEMVNDDSIFKACGGRTAHK